MTKRRIRSLLKKSLSLTLSLIFLLGNLSMFAGAEGKAVPSMANNTVTEVPEYVHRLSRLVKSKMNETDFASIELEIGNPEMVIDGQAQPISADESIVPVIENGEINIPEAVIGAVPDIPEVQGNCGNDEEVNRKITEPELEALGYDVEYNEETEKILITEPFQQMRLLVKTETGRVSKTYGATDVINISNNVTVLQYDSKEKTKTAYDRFRNDPQVLICAQDSLLYMEDCRKEEVQTVSVQGDEEGSPYKNWGTVRVGADQYMANLPMASELEEVVVAIIDTGVDVDHPFLAGRIREGGWDFTDDDPVPEDGAGHGTHCAGIVRDATKENVKIVPIKVTQGYTLDLSLTLEAINYAVITGADIISMSFGVGLISTDQRLLFEDALGHVYANNVISVASAGNEGWDSLEKKPLYPARFPLVITVSSCNEKNGFSSFSNHGKVIDICAPGENILSSVPGGGFEKYSGTSMSAPLVAAAAALVKSNHPNMTNDEVEEWLCHKAIDTGEPGWDEYYGAGILFVGGEDYTGGGSGAFDRPVESMSFTEEEAECDWGELILLNLNFQPFIPTGYMQTEFTISDESILSFVGSSVLTEQIGVIGLKPGTAVITATYPYDGGFTDSITVTVKSHKISSVGVDHFILDDMLYLFGQNGKQLNPLRSEDGNILTGIEKCSRYYALRSDGTLWTRRETRNSSGEILIPPVQVTDPAGNPLSNIVDVCENTALSSNGTVWVSNDRNPVYGDKNIYFLKQLLKADGTPLTGIKKITANAAITEDGHVYCFNLVSYATELTYNDGTPVSDVVDAYYLPTHAEYVGTYTVVLKRDGTVWVKGLNYYDNLLGTPEYTGDVTEFIQVKTSPETYLTNVKQIYFSDPNDLGINHTTYAVLNDGSLWAWGGIYGQTVQNYDYGFLGIGEYDNSKIYASRIKIDRNVYLENVDRIIDAGNYRMCCALKDGSVWQTGYIDTYDYSTDTYTEYILYAQPMEYLGNIIRLSGEDEQKSELILPEDSEIYVDESREYIYGIPAGMRADDFEALFNVSQDGYVSVITSGRYVGTGSLVIVHDSHGEVVAEYTVVIFGDLDGNGRITAADLSIAQRGLVNGFEDEVFEFAANIVKPTKRNKFNAQDITALNSALVNEPINQTELAELYKNAGW
ncbi:MAG: S8 family serine peptidase [Clostridiales bacterium]|nr:S8 family serine peptidase [Clostridiales bacterium]